MKEPWRLATRQEQILRLVAAGMADKEIAARLGVSPATVRTHLHRLYCAHGFHNRAEAVAAWLSQQPFLSSEVREEQLENEMLEISQRSEPWPQSEDGGAEVLLAGVAKSEPTVPWGLQTIRRHPWWVLAALSSVAAGMAVAHAIAPQQLSGRLPFAPSQTSPTAAPPGPTGQSPVSGSSAAPSQISPRAGAAPGAAAAQVPLASPAVTPRPAPAPLAVHTPASVMQGAGQLLLVNAERTAAGLLPLTSNDCLIEVASENALRIASQGFVSGADGPSLDRVCALGSTQPAENLGYWSNVDDIQMNLLFVANPQQRAAILGRFHYMGAAWAISASGVAYLAVEFA